MASSGGIGLALGIGGGLALLAAPFTGGASLYVYAAGIALTGAATALALTADQPEPISQVHRQTGSTSDAEAPWETVYGRVVKGAAVPWTGIGGDDDQYTGGDYVLACHPCEGVVAVQVGDWTFPIVTSVDGDTNYNGLGLILNTGQTIDPNVFPADWYVPVKGGVNGDSPWWRNPQDDKNTGDRPHIGIKFFNGGHAGTEAHMASRFGAKYSGVARKFTGHFGAHVIVRAHTEMGTMGGMPEIIWLLDGKKDVQDYTAGNAAYRNNAAYVFADFCRETWGTPVTDIVSVNPGETLQHLAAECDDTTWAGSGSAARYTFDGVIRDDEDPVDVLRKICEHMAGGYSARGSQFALYTGTAKTPWTGGPITDDDCAGDDDAVTIHPPDQDSWANTLVPHFVVQMPNDENGQRVLHGKMEPAKVDVTDATYVTEDGGITLRQDIKFPACRLGRRAKWLAWTALKQMRLGASATFRLKKRCSVLERGDVFVATMPLAGLFADGTEWQVVGKRWLLGPDTFAVEIDAVRYDDDIYTPGTTPTEDAIGVVPRNRSSIMPAITGLAATVEEDSAQVNVHGRQTVDVLATWNLVSNILVRNAGDIRIGWKQQSNSWPGRATTVPGDEIQAVLPGLLEGVPYHIRARAEGTPSAGRTDKPIGEWTADLAFTPTSGFISAGRPGTPTLSHNEITNPNFKQELEGWEVVPGATGTIEWVDNAGRFGTASIRLTVVSHDLAIRPADDELIPVEVGQRRRFRFWRRITNATVGVTVDIVLRALYYSSFDTADFISSTLIGSLSTNTGPVGYELVTGHHTVPDDPTIVAMRIEAAAKYTDGGYTVRFDAFQQKRVLGATGPMLTTADTLNSGDTGAGSDWTTLRSITVGKPGDPVGLSFSWEHRLGDPGSLINTATLQIRVQRFDADGTSNETNILPAMAMGNEFVPDASGHTIEWGRWEALIANCTDDSLDAGTYIYRAQFNTDRIGAKAAVRNRIIGWRLESAGG